MPKKEIDYANTIIYKIVCKDLNIKDIFVGHTTNLIQRKYGHKRSCNNIYGKKYNCQLYNIIRENGGWDNWDMIPVGYFNCKNAAAARIKEQEYYEKLNANLNSAESFNIIKSLIGTKIFYCDKCNIFTNTQMQLDKHFITSKHTNPTNSSKKSQKSPKNNYCKCCDYNTCNKKDYVKHLTTRKHQLLKKSYKNPTNPTQKSQIIIENICECGKIYKHRSSLHFHKQACKYVDTLENDIENEILTTNNISKDIMMKLIAENSEIKTMLFKQFEAMQKQQEQMNNHISELIPKIGNNNTTYNKNSFNINIFLDTHCKNAKTINEFLDTMVVKFEDLQITQSKGICEGISNIFMENMKKLSLHERPIHCTDLKRETVYIKSAGDIIGGKSEPAKWQRDDNNKILKQAISKVGHIQVKSLDLWKDKYPNWETNSNDQTNYMILVRNSTDDFKEKRREEKVVKSICNNVYIKG